MKYQSAAFAQPCANVDPANRKQFSNPAMGTRRTKKKMATISTS